MECSFWRCNLDTLHYTTHTHILCSTLKLPHPKGVREWVKWSSHLAIYWDITSFNLQHKVSGPVGGCTIVRKNTGSYMAVLWSHSLRFYIGWWQDCTHQITWSYSFSIGDIGDKPGDLASHFSTWTWCQPCRDRRWGRCVHGCCHAGKWAAACLWGMVIK